MLFAPIIIFEWLFSLIYQRSNCSSDSRLTWKSFVIMASPFLFCYFLHNSLLCAALISALNVTSLCVLDKSVGSSSLCFSLTQYINDFNGFCWTWVTVNLLDSGVLLAYPLQADCIHSSSSTLRWPIPSGSVIVSSHIPFLKRTLLMPSIVKILMVVNGTIAIFSLFWQLINLMGLINCIILMVS